MNTNEFHFYESKTCFCEFKSINNIICFVYILNREYALVAYDIIKKKIINKNIVNKNGGSFKITDVRHHLDKNLKRDLILHNNMYNNDIYIWDFKNWQKLTQIYGVNKAGALYSSCFYEFNNIIYILTTNICWHGEHGNIKVFNLQSNKLKEIPNSNESAIYIDTYYDSKFDKNLIVTCNDKGHINFYDFQNNTLFKRYDDNDTKYQFLINDFVVDEKEPIKTLIGSCYKAHIKIWDFYKGNLIKRIMFNYDGIYNLYGLCILNNNYLLVGTNETNDNGNINGSIILIDLNTKKVIKKIRAHTGKVKFIKFINTNNGKILVSGGLYSDIIFWENKELEFNIKDTINNQSYL